MSLSKHVLNDPKSLVVESLQGLCALNHQVTLDLNGKVIHRKFVDKNRVHLICGGGAGHEPSHAAFVGEGILSAAVSGNVFASPNANQVRKSIDLVDNDKGTVIIIKNYTGDILHFGLAREQYAAHNPAKADKVKFLVVGDDVAVGKTQGSIVGRRGLAGVVLVYKIAGALASYGGSLDEVYDIASLVASRVGTIGIGLDHCHVPGTATGEAHLKADEVDIGLGIHNEPGIKRVSPIPPLNKLIPELLELITSTTDPERSFLPFRHDGQDQVVLLINNLGGISELELGGIAREATQALHSLKIKLVRVIAGTFMTSLNMPGFSLTLLLLPRADEQGDAAKIISLLDAPADAPGWKWASKTVPELYSPTSTSEPAKPPSPPQPSGAGLSAPDTKSYIDAIQRACQAIIDNEPEITRMDTVAGDGDCGLTLKSGAQGVRKAIEEGRITGQNVVADIVAISAVTDDAMDGTSGALYSIFFSALAQSLAQASSSGASTATFDVWAPALTAARDRLYTYTRARPPSRTLIDPLAAFIDTLPQGLQAAVSSAAKAAEETRNVKAKAGRSAYIESELIGQVCDPGAWGVKVILEALLQ